MFNNINQNEQEKKLDWMYKGANSLVDREDYLLGRAADKTLDQLNAEEKQKKLGTVGPPKNHVEHECIPPSIRDYKMQQQLAEQVDLQAKLQEDPLLMIQKREEESRRQFLQNPVQLAKLQKALNKQQTKLNKNKPQSSGNDLDNELVKKLHLLKNNTFKMDFHGDKSVKNSKDLDTILMHKFNALKSKLTDEDLKDVMDGKFTDTEDSDEDDDDLPKKKFKREPSSSDERKTKIKKVKKKKSKKREEDSDEDDAPSSNKKKKHSKKSKKNKDSDANSSDSEDGAPSSSKKKKRSKKLKKHKDSDENSSDSDDGAVKKKKLSKKSKKSKDSSDSEDDAPKKRKHVTKSKNKRKDSENSSDSENNAQSSSNKNKKIIKKSKKVREKDSSSEERKKTSKNGKHDSNRYKRDPNKKREISSNKKYEDFVKENRNEFKNNKRGEPNRYRHEEFSKTKNNFESYTNDMRKDYARRSRSRSLEKINKRNKIGRSRSRSEEKNRKSNEKDKRERSRNDKDKSRDIKSDTFERYRQSGSQDKRIGREASLSRDAPRNRSNSKEPVRKSPRNRSRSNRSLSREPPRSRSRSKREIPIDWTKNAPKNKSISRKAPETSSDDTNSESERRIFGPQRPQFPVSKKDENSDSDVERYKPQNFGLVKSDGTKIPLSNIKPAKIEKPKVVEATVRKEETRERRKRLTEAEKEQLRSEMMANAAVRDVERATNLKIHRDSDLKEANSVDFNPDFVHKELLKSANNSTVESRIRANLNNIQRSGRDMNSHFSRRN